MAGFPPPDGKGPDPLGFFDPSAPVGPIVPPISIPELFKRVGDSFRGRPLLGVVDPPEPESQFRDWWVNWVEEHAPEIEGKSREYGTNSLMEMGRIFARAGGRDSIEDAEAIEIGCFLYAYGKIQRVADAMLRGQSPKVDSWGDTMVYAAMAMYTREHGSWP